MVTGKWHLIDIESYPTLPVTRSHVCADIKVALDRRPSASQADCSSHHVPTFRVTLAATSPGCTRSRLFISHSRRSVRGTAS